MTLVLVLSPAESSTLIKTTGYDLKIIERLGFEPVSCGAPFCSAIFKTRSTCGKLSSFGVEKSHSVVNGEMPCQYGGLPPI